MKILNKIKNMSTTVAIVIMVLLVLAGLTLGNMNANRRAILVYSSDLEDIRVNILELTAKSTNYLTLATSMGLTGKVVDDMRKAKSDAENIASDTTKIAEVAAGLYGDVIRNLDLAKDALNAAIENERNHETERKAIYNAWSEIKNSIYENTKSYNDAIDFFRRMNNGTLIKTIRNPAGYLEID